MDNTAKPVSAISSRDVIDELTFKILNDVDINNLLILKMEGLLFGTPIGKEKKEETLTNGIVNEWIRRLRKSAEILENNYKWLVILYDKLCKQSKANKGGE